MLMGQIGSYYSLFINHCLYKVASSAHCVLLGVLVGLISHDSMTGRCPLGESGTTMVSWEGNSIECFSGLALKTKINTTML